MKYSIFVLLLCIVSCNNSGRPVANKKPAPPKGELAFLLQYGGRMPSDVGFLSNHIMERRLANLMKENYEPFIKATNMPNVIGMLYVDTVKQVVHAEYWHGKLVHHEVIVDVANDAVWVDYMNTTDSTQEVYLHYKDNTSLAKPGRP